MTLHTQVAILGGGIYGCGLALQLTEKGWSDVTVVEKNELAAGSTWHAAGFCTHYSFNPTHVFMRKFSTELYHRLEVEGLEPTGYHRCRGLRLTADSDRIDEFKHGVSVGRQLGIEFEIISPKEAHDVFPLMNMSGLKGALLEPIDGFVDPTQATTAMMRLARKSGSKILRNSPVGAISQTQSGEWKLTTPEHTIVAEHIVIATGIWSHEVGQLIGLNLPIVPMLHQYLVTADHQEVEACTVDSIPLVRHHDEQWYTRREGNGLILGAYESDPQTWCIDGIPASFGMELLDPELDRIEHLTLGAIQRIPVLGDAGIKMTVHGPVSYTPDGQPLIGPAPGIRNVWVAAGSGFGIGEGPGAGKLLAEWMVEQSPPLHMWAFDPRRFGDYADRDYRVKKSIEVFAKQFGTHYPLEERLAGRLKKTTPIYSRLDKGGAQFGVAYGWERANWFATRGESHTLSFRRTEWFEAVRRECLAVCESVGVIDLSSFAKFQVAGSSAEQFLERLSANSIPKEIGDIRLCHFLNRTGRIECEFTITRTGKTEFYLVCAAVAEQHHADWLFSNIDTREEVRINPMTTQRGVLAVSGPNSRILLESLTSTDLSTESFPWLSAKFISISGIDVLALRVSFSGELGWELHHDINDQVELYEILKNADFAPKDFGFYSMNSLRMEKAYKAWGTELTVENTAGELGLDRFVSVENRNFLGRESLLVERGQGPQKLIAYVEVDAIDADALGGEAVFDGDEVVGVMMSGAYGHRVEKSLGFAFLDSDFAKPHTELQTEIIGERCGIRVLSEPVYDASNSRLRA